MADNAGYSDVRKVAFAKLTDQKALESVAEKYLSDFYTTTDFHEWGKVSNFIEIVKKHPQLFKGNRIEISVRINALYNNVPSEHIDRENGRRNSDCHEDRVREAFRQTAASLGLVFPPYPFDD